MKRRGFIGAALAWLAGPLLPKPSIPADWVRIPVRTWPKGAPVRVMSYAMTIPISIEVHDFLRGHIATIEGPLDL